MRNNFQGIYQQKDFFDERIVLPLRKSDRVKVRNLQVCTITIEK